MNPNTQPSQDETGKRTFFILPYIKGTIDHIDRILNKYNIQTVSKPFKKIKQILRSPKDSKLSLSSAGVYKMPCSCRKVYFGETGKVVNIHMKERQRDVKLKHITQSTLSEHNIKPSNTV